VCETRHASKDVPYGALIELCDDAVAHLAEILGQRGEGSAVPVKNTIRAFTLAGARAVVAEEDYFDLDFRSEFAATQATRFTARYTETLRLHFFGRKPGSRHEIINYVRRARRTYLGYMIIRPEKYRLGRSVVPPFAELHIDHEDGPTALAIKGNVQHHVSTTVVETVQLFGEDLRVVGLPFMTQDGHLLRCAHVSGWICHYTAVLRGLVGRRPTAYFADIIAGTWGRTYPSAGLDASSLMTMMNLVDLPSEVLDQHKLKRRRILAWHDSDAHVRRVAEAGKKGAQRDRTWIRENLTSSVCRYLNSGIPSILSRDGLGHTQVVVGYLRDRDLTTKSSQSSSGVEGIADSARDLLDENNDVTHLLVSDDLFGPVLAVAVDELVEEILADHPTSVIVPLPRGLWLSSGAAENMAAALLRSFAVKRASELRPDFDSAKLADDATALEALAYHLSRNPMTRPKNERLYGIRSYACAGAQLKRSFAARTADSAASRLLSMLQLPRFVWVCEVVDRERRLEGLPDVVASVVVDASASSIDDSPGPSSSLAEMLEVLFVQVPGWASTSMEFPDEAPDDEESEKEEEAAILDVTIDDEWGGWAPVIVEWVAGPQQPYASGVSTAAASQNWDAENVLSQAKIAVVGH